VDASRADHPGGLSVSGTGTRTRRRVPPEGCDSIAISPPRWNTRSRMLTSSSPILQDVVRPELSVFDPPGVAILTVVPSSPKDLDSRWSWTSLAGGRECSENDRVDVHDCLGALHLGRRPRERPGGVAGPPHVAASLDTPPAAAGLARHRRADSPGRHRDRQRIMDAGAPTSRVGSRPAAGRPTGSHCLPSGARGR
jgi:hypothetical protein